MYNFRMPPYIVAMVTPKKRTMFVSDTIHFTIPSSSWKWTKTISTGILTRILFLISMGYRINCYFRFVLNLLNRN